MDIPIELCVSAKAYRPASTKRLFFVSLVVVLYAIVIPYCYLTAGEPRRLAIISAQQLADKKWASFSGLDFDEDNSTTTDDESSSASLPSSSKVASTVVPDAPLNSNGDDFSEEAIGDYSTLGQPAAPKSFMSGWFGPSKEQKQSQAEFDKFLKKFKQTSDDGEAISLPPSYLPSAWACLALFSLLTAHALFYLLCHWIVDFKAYFLFVKETKLSEKSFLLITPPPNRGKPALAPVHKAAVSGTLQVDFQRQAYLYVPPSSLGAAAKDFKNGLLTLSSSPVDLPLLHYWKSTGHRSEMEIEQQQEKWGKNHLAVQIPSFLELLQLQLLSPLAMFQVFCAILWLLDEYWTYTLWTLCSVVIFEATTVFQRTRTQQMLGGMAPKPSPIYVLRCGKWSLLTTKDILPGDLISLAFKRSY